MYMLFQVLNIWINNDNDPMYNFPYHLSNLKKIFIINGEMN